MPCVDASDPLLPRAPVLRHRGRPCALRQPAQLDPVRPLGFEPRCAPRMHAWGCELTFSCVLFHRYCVQEVRAAITIERCTLKARVGGLLTCVCCLVFADVQLRCTSDALIHRPLSSLPCPLSHLSLANLMVAWLRTLGAGPLQLFDDQQLRLPVRFHASSLEPTCTCSMKL